MLEARPGWRAVIVTVTNAKIFFSVWYAAQEERDRKQAAIDAQRAQSKEQTKTQREEMRKEMLGEK